MLEKDPMVLEKLTYAWVVGLSLWGGFTSFLRRHRSDMPLRKKVVVCASDMCICVFVGMVTFFLCQWAQWPAALSAAAIALTSHMGTKAIMLSEKALEFYIQKATGIKTDDL